MIDLNGRKGEWIQEYTRRGSPMRGKFRFRSNKEKLWEIGSGILLVLAIS
jgi:hypothetical protein